MTDLDARVAALIGKIAYYRYVPIEMVDAKRAEIEQALRAELQKPAQEEITDAEILTAAGDWAVSLMGPVHLLRICRQVFNFRASKGEKT